MDRGFLGQEREPGEQESVRLAAEFDEGAKEDAQSGEQQPRPAFEQLDDAPTDEEGEQGKRQNGQHKFH
jgi:hypothetical protein